MDASGIMVITCLHDSREEALESAIRMVQEALLVEPDINQTWYKRTAKPGDQFVKQLFLVTTFSFIFLSQKNNICTAYSGVWLGKLRRI